MSLITDTSVFFYLVYGSKAQKERIKEIFRKFNNDISINETITAEIGRTLFKSFFIAKDKIFAEIERVKQGESIIDDFWKMLKQKLMKSQRKKQEFNRIDIIIDNIHDRLLAVISFDELTEGDQERAKLDIIECIIFQIENELLKFEIDLNQYNYLGTSQCYQSKWKMVCSDPDYGYTLILDDSCGKSKCPNRLEILKEIFHANHSIIHSYLLEINTICKDYKINPDNRLIKTLNDLVETFGAEGNNFKKISFRSKPCWNLADFLICLLVDDNSCVYTVNFNHFFPILLIGRKETRLIKFSP